LLEAQEVPLVKPTGMGVSFFPSYPLTGGISVPLQTMRTSTCSLSSRDFVRVRSFEAAS